MIKKQKKKRQYINWEDKLIRIGSRALTITTIFLCIILGTINTFSGEQDPNTYLTADFTALYEACDYTKIITDPVTDDNFDPMVEKIKNSGLDILDKGIPKYDKFDQDEINMTSDISLSSQEIALLYSYIHMNSHDPYDVIIRQLNITNENNIINIYSVCTIDFDSLFTKKVKGSYQSEALSQLPKRVFIINSLTFEDDVPLYTTALYNNMDEAQSNNVTTLINSVTIDIDMSKYIPDLITKFLDDLSTKTNSTLSFENNGIKLTLNN